jgi:hypothetical protein
MVAIQSLVKVGSLRLLIDVKDAFRYASWRQFKRNLLCAWRWFLLMRDEVIIDGETRGCFPREYHHKFVFGRFVYQAFYA